MIGKTNAISGGGGDYEILNITLTTNQSEHDILIGKKVTLKYGENPVETIIWEGETITRKIPANVPYSILAEKDANYTSPANKDYVAQKDNINNVVMQYDACKLRINAAIKKGSFVDGVVKIFKNDIEYKIITINSGSYITILLPFNDSDIYRVSPEKVGEYSAKPIDNIKANVSSKEITIQYVYVSPFWVIFDESKSTTILETGGDADARDNFFKKFRRCLAKPQANGTSAVTYLNNEDSNKYEDGTPTNFGNGSLGLQMMVHFPKYYYKSENLGGERYKLWCCEEKPDDTYKEEREALVGVFEAFSDGGKLNSWAGRLSTGNKTITTFYNEAQANGKQWGLIDYRVHKTLANLFCLKYGNTNISTKNSAIPCSGGTKPYDSNTGSTLSLGNKDGLVNYSSSFLGVEDCYYSKFEMVQGVNIINNMWHIYDGGLLTNANSTQLESAGFTNVRVVGSGVHDGYINKILHGDFADVIPTNVGGSETTYYSDYYYQYPGNKILLRSGYSGNWAYCGVFFAHAYKESLDSASGFSSRLCFYGKIEVKTKDEFIALTPDYKG